MNSEHVIRLQYRQMIEPYVPLSLRGSGQNAVEYVISQYAQPHRVYHSTSHLAHVLSELNHYRWDAWLSERDRLTACVALLLHDVVYDLEPNGVSNEDLSADWAGWFIRKCGLAIDQQQVEAAIKATQGHQPTDIVSLVVCWCDLWGFTQSADVVKANSDKIRQEYLAVYTAEQFEAGRRVFLSSYRNPFKTYQGAPLWLRAKAHWLNHRANKHLKRELEELSSSLHHKEWLTGPRTK